MERTTVFLALASCQQPDNEYNHSVERPKQSRKKTTNRRKTVLKRSTKLTRVCLVRAILMRDAANSTNDYWPNPTEANAVISA